MRTPAEIKQVIADLEYTIALPGDCEYEEQVMAINAELLRWVLGEENHATEAAKALRMCVKEAKRIEAEAN
jgi:hypothetical protein